MTELSLTLSERHTADFEMVANGDPMQLLRRILDAGGSVQRFELVQPSLHRIFLDKVGAAGVEEGMSGHG